MFRWFLPSVLLPGSVAAAGAAGTVGTRESMDVSDDPVGSVDNDRIPDDLVSGLHLEAIPPWAGYPQPRAR